MPTIDQIYRDNLKLLAKETGTATALAELLGKSPGQVSQWINASKDSKTGKPRRLSTDMAREIESKCGKPPGWMDQAHDAAVPTVREPAVAYGADPEAPPLPGERFDALSPDEQRLLDNFRELFDTEEKHHILEEIATKAAKSRAMREQIEQRVLAQYGIKPAPVKHSADLKKTETARAALRVTENLRQRSLFEPTRKK